MDAPRSGAINTTFTIGEEHGHDTLLVIVIVLVILGGGGWYGRGRWY
jgi:hypothetical protein